MELPGDSRFVDLLRPYLADELLTQELIAQLRLYLELLLRWNAHTNLTAVRAPEQLLQRQVGESLFAAKFVPGAGSLLDFGSGAGFPGIPLQLLKPELKVTLAESQGKKASFLREAVRTLALPADVWAGRVEQMPAAMVFDAVVMRAVDDTGAALPLAAARVRSGGCWIRYVAGAAPIECTGWRVEAAEDIPLSSGRLVRLVRE